MQDTTNFSAEINKLIEANPMFKSFRKYYGMEQAGKNDYEVGCIQTANALMPIIVKLITNK
jgi:hypothetical protein